MLGIHLKTVLPVVLLGVLRLDFAESSFYNVNNKEKEQDLHHTVISESLLRGGHAVKFPTFGNEELAVEYQNNRRLSQENVIPNDKCMGEASGKKLRCTAKDVRVSRAYNGNDITSCERGTNIKLLLIADLIAGAYERYDIGMFVSEVAGEDAETGSSCTRTYLDSAVDSAVDVPCDSTTLNYAEGNITTKCKNSSGTSCETNEQCAPGETCVVISYETGGPFYNAECTEDTSDTCGDIEQGVPTFHAFNVTVPCQANTNDNNGGLLAINVCLSWDNAASDGDKKPSCTNIIEAIPNTPSKCNCEDVTVGNVVVCDVSASITTDQSCSDDGSNDYTLTPTVTDGADCTWTFSPDDGNDIIFEDSDCSAINPRDVLGTVDGTYDVTLTALETTDGVSCPSSVTTTITLSTIQASIYPDPFCSPDADDGSNDYTLTPTVTDRENNDISSMTSVTCDWTFSSDDGNDITFSTSGSDCSAINARNVPEISDGTYDVTLTATDGSNTCSSTNTTSIELSKVELPPQSIILSCSESYERKTNATVGDVEQIYIYEQKNLSSSINVTLTTTFTDTTTNCDIKNVEITEAFYEINVTGNLTGSCDNTLTFDSNVTGGNSDSLVYNWTFTTDSGYSNSSNETNGIISLPPSDTGTYVTASLVVTTDIGGATTCSGSETLYEMVYSPIQVTLLEPEMETCTSTLEVEANITGGSGNYELTGTSDPSNASFTCHDMSETCTFDIQSICETVTGTVSITDTGTETGTECPSKNDSIRVTKATTIFPS